FRRVLFRSADEEEHLVLPDRPAEATAVLRLIELADLRAERSLPDVGGIALGSEDRAFEVVRSRAGDGVDAAAGEAALPDVVRRDEDLDLLNGIERDRLRAGAAARSARAGKAEQIVVDRAVDLNRVVAVVAAGHEHERAFAGAAGDDVRVRAGEILQLAVDRGKGLDLLGRHLRGRAGVVRIDDRIGRGGDGDRLGDG